MNRLLSLLLSGLLLSACSPGVFRSLDGYSADLEPVPILEEASTLASNWSSMASGGSSSSSFGSHYTSSSSRGGSFDCAADDLAQLAEDLRVAFEEDIFGKGFQLTEGALIETGAAAAPRAALIKISFQDQVESGWIGISLTSTGTPGQYTYHIEVEEESR